ncbi:hypothetical protein [Burkholderia diffusa]|uniref:hypothetical protein n=1 Tax=Burkholderia diffusa TaxID=488732 RepID=UPI002ABDB0F4|nr:hypothetical protein [Burkholderia diffusa]
MIDVEAATRLAHDAAFVRTSTWHGAIRMMSIESDPFTASWRSRACTTSRKRL